MGDNFFIFLTTNWLIVTIYQSLKLAMHRSSPFYVDYFIFSINDQTITELDYE